MIIEAPPKYRQRFQLIKLSPEENAGNTKAIGLTHRPFLLILMMLFWICKGTSCIQKMNHICKKIKKQTIKVSCFRRRHRKHTMHNKFSTIYTNWY